jgi:uncharacterized 2Fe-2S/4Fe-4S cluster protein (DUF4445 family)
VAETGITGIVGSGIIEAIAEMFLSGILTTDGVIDGALAAKSDRIIPNGRTFAYVVQSGNQSGEVDITITQNDVRAIQLAKAALYAGVRLLMEKLDIDHVDRIKLAGAFGSFIDPKYAMVLGLIPDCDVDHVTAVGNAAGTGARMALLNRGHRREIEQLVTDIEKIETALEPRFQEHFVNAMGIPNRTEAFPKLAEAVTLPAPRFSSGDESGGGDGAGGGRRRRRRGDTIRLIVSVARSQGSAATSDPAHAFKLPGGGHAEGLTERSHDIVPGHAKVLQLPVFERQ